MTEPINKILATTSQAFTTAQQAQARANIGAQKSIAYSYSGQTITGIDGSAVGNTTTYGYSGTTITSIDGSAVGNTTTYGYSGTTITSIDGSAVGNTTTYGYSGTTITSIDGSAVGLNTASANNGITGNGSSSQPLGVSSSLTFSDSLAKASISPNALRMSGNAATASLNAGTFGMFNSSQESVYLYPTAMWFTDSDHSTAEVTKGSIERWNSPPYQIKVYKPTTATQYLSTSDYPKYPVGVDGTFVIVNLGSGPYVTYPDSQGATANVPKNQSAQLIWDSQASSWVKWNN